MNWFIQINGLLLSMIVLFSSMTHGETLFFSGETLHYSAKFNGMPTARSTLSYTQIDSNHIQIQWDLKSKSALRFLFHVDNQYRSNINTHTWQTGSFEKTVNQKNIKQSFKTQYNREQNTAFTDNNLKWQVPEHSMDILSMLYHIRLQSLHPGDSLSYIIDLESHVWRVSGIVSESNETNIAKTVELTFNPELPIIDRAWKTDLMTNRISKESTLLTIKLGPAPKHVPLSIKFKNSDSTVEMHLDSEHIE